MTRATASEQLALRRVRREHLGMCLSRFRAVNDDDLGKTYLAECRRGQGWIVVEFCPAAVDGCQVAKSRSGRTEAYYLVLARAGE